MHRKNPNSVIKGRGLVTAIIAGLLTIISILVMVEALVHVLREHHREEQRVDIINRLAEIRARLEGELNATLYLTRGIIAYVSTHPDISTEDFTMLATDVLNFGNNIRNIALARNNVISHVYPVMGNEAVLGLDYRTLEGQWPAVKRAIDIGSTVVAGPINLVQGGRGFIARTPIYTRDPDSGNSTIQSVKYWGLTSIVIDEANFFRNAEINKYSDTLDIALRGKDSEGADGDLIYGDSAIFAANPVLQNVTLPNGSWQLAAIPSAGWGGTRPETLITRLLGWALALLIGSLVALLFKERYKNIELALHDQLTGLPNRRLLDDRLGQAKNRATREKAQFTLFFIDLDQFKKINDSKGHYIGDQVLIHVAQQLLRNTRATDTVARVGGDEFVVVAPEIQTDHDAQLKSEAISEIISAVTMIDGLDLNLSVSVGYAIYPRDGDGFENLLRNADRRMYSMKLDKNIHTLRPA